MTVVPKLAAVALIWFLVGLALLLARAEGKPPLAIGCRLVSGVMLAAYLLLDASWDAAFYGAADLDPAVASFAHSISATSASPIPGWRQAASRSCCGWVVLSTRVLGRWLGWWAFVAGVGLILVRFAWSADIWIAAYALFWLWVIIICIQLIRRKIALPEAAAAASEGSASASERSSDPDLASQTLRRAMKRDVVPENLLERLALRAGLVPPTVPPDGLGGRDGPRARRSRQAGRVRDAE